MEDNETTNIEKFYDKLSTLNALIKRAIKSKFTKIALPLFFGIILLLLLLPILLNNSYLKFQIAQKFSKISGVNLVIKGNVRVALLPTPKILIKDVILQNYKDDKSNRVYNLYAESIGIKISLLNASVKKIVLNNAILESHFDKEEPLNRKNKLSIIIEDLAKSPPTNEKKQSSGISSKLFPITDIDPSQFKHNSFPNLEINNGEIILYDISERLRSVNSINIKIQINHKKIYASGNFNNENIISNFEALAKFNSTSEKPKSYLRILSPVAEIHLSGNFTTENLGILNSNFNGKIEGEIQELKTFYKAYIGGKDIFFNKMKYNNMSLKFNADLNNQAGEIIVENILINSALLNGKGNIIANLANEIPLIDLDFDLDNFDLDSIWSNNTVVISRSQKRLNEIDNLHDDAVGAILPTPDAGATSKLLDNDQKTAETTPINFDLSNKIKNLDLTAEIKIKTIGYLGGFIKDADIYLTLSNSGKIAIIPMVFKMPGEGVFRMNGAFDNSSGLPKFIGQFDVKGQNLEKVFKWLKIESQNLKFNHLNEYEIHSNVMLLPNEINLNNFYLNLNKGDSEFLGEIKIDNNGSTPQIFSKFQISNFNIDNYFLTSGQNIYLSPGSLIKKLLWLNDISSNKEIAIAFDKLIYKGEEFPEQSLTLKFRRGYLEISDLNLKSDKTNLNANIILDISNVIPKFYLKISADDFDYDSRINDEDDNFKSIVKKQSFINQFFALPSLDGFNGKINLDFRHLMTDGLEIKNAKLIGILHNGNLPNADISADIFGGSLKYKGSLAIKLNKIINGTLSITDTDLNSLFSHLFKIENLFGTANIAASVTSSANNSDDFRSRLTSDLKFNANSPSIKGYGLNDLMTKMTQPKQYANELQEPENILLNPDATTIFRQASGSIKLYGKAGGKIEAKISAPVMNGVLSGSINLASKSTNMLFNAIFLSGTRQKHTALNIATNLSGNISNISQSTNIDQVKQYLGLIKIEPQKINPTQTRNDLKKDKQKTFSIREIPIESK